MCRTKRFHFVFICLLLTVTAACSSATPSSTTTFSTQGVSASSAAKTISFVIGSENEAVMKSIVQPWFTSQGWTANYQKLGSVDQKILLQSGKMVDSNGAAFNVMWPANKAWALIGDTHHLLVDNPNAVFYTPVVVAGRKALMDQLGWSGKAISVDDLVSQVQAGKQLWTSNPMESNSGAVFMIGLANRYAGNDSTTPLTMDQVNNTGVLDKLHQFYTAVNHSASSTGYVTNNCLAAPNCDLLVTYETLVIQHNQANLNDLLTMAYLSDAFLYSDATPQFVQNGGPDDPAKQAIFNQFLVYMQTQPAEQQLIALGERPAQTGLRLDENDSAVRSVFNPDWGVQPTITLQPITLPEGPVLEQLFYNYQVAARPAYDMVACLDSSGSMGDANKWTQLIEGLSYITDKDQATSHQLLANPNDLTTFLTFSSAVNYVSPTVTGADYPSFQSIFNTINAGGPGGGTDIFGCLSHALDLFNQHPQVEGRPHLLVLMTDGQQSSENTITDYLSRWNTVTNLRVIAVGIGDDVDMKQLHQIVDPMEGLLIFTSHNITASTWNEVSATDIGDAMKQAIGSK